MERKKKAPKSVAVTVVPVAVPQAPMKRELVLEGDPQAQLAFAKKAADALMSWITQKPHKVMIRGEQYLEFGDWQILARFYGATVGVEWTKPVEKGWEARAIVTRNGEVISSAEAMCTRVEKNWKDRDEFMLKSMAQTRASAKALRQAFGWVAELAGMKSTPAEEMGSVYDQTPIKDDAPVITIGADEEEILDHTDGDMRAPIGASVMPKETPQTSAQQRKRIFALLKARGVDVTDGDACRRYVADETQLELVEANYSAVIDVLEANR